MDSISLIFDDEGEATTELIDETKGWFIDCQFTNKCDYASMLNKGFYFQPWCDMVGKPSVRLDKCPIKPKKERAFNDK